MKKLAALLVIGSCVLALPARAQNNTTPGLDGTYTMVLGASAAACLGLDIGLSAGLMSDGYASRGLGISSIVIGSIATIAGSLMLFPALAGSSTSSSGTVTISPVWIAASIATAGLGVGTIYLGSHAVSHDRASAPPPVQAAPVVAPVPAAAPPPPSMPAPMGPPPPSLSPSRGAPSAPPPPQLHDGFSPTFLPIFGAGRSGEAIFGGAMGFVW